MTHATQEALNDAVLYALKAGCFFPVKEPPSGAGPQKRVQWGAMRNLHQAIAAHFGSRPGALLGLTTWSRGG